ncbi:MFS-type transporter SLC18B1 isoform X2 [Hydra vulgaris]|uniref:MFS-type transporter SLC18B1 isoform X2 n=1 Tax=Hydra vulgaris TaxID=6087 RepID=A0ABM4BSW2_HYDVU
MGKSIFPKCSPNSSTTSYLTKLPTSTYKQIENNRSTFKVLSKYKIVALLSIKIFISYGAFALIAPFFTMVAKTKGVSQTISGLIFSIFALVVFFIAPLIGKSVSKFGVKFTLIIGCFIEAYTEILFGYTSLIIDHNTFIVYCFLIRSATAFGTACTQTAELALVAVVFKENKASIMGILEIFTGAGLMTGPIFGGILYSVGDFKLPFVVYGGLTFFLLVLLFYILPNKYELSSFENSSLQTQISITKTVCLPGIFFVCLVIVLCATMITFIEPLLTLQLMKITKNGLTSDKVGYFFAIMPGTYTFMSPIIGFLADKKIKSRYMIIMGQVLSITALLFLGPTPLFKSFVPETLLTLGLSLGFLGISVSCALIPCLADMHITVFNYGYIDCIATSGVLSGIFSSCFSIGSFIGPTLGSFLAEKLSFEYTATILAGLILISCVLLVLETIKNMRKKPFSETEDFIY